MARRRSSHTLRREERNPTGTTEEALVIKDVVIRWSYPEKECHWNSLQEAMDNVCQTHLTVDDMLQFDYHGKKMYSLHARLEGLARVILPLTQILDAFAEYFFNGQSQQFVVDKNFEMLRTLA